MVKLLRGGVAEASNWGRFAISLSWKIILLALSVGSFAGCGGGAASSESAASVPIANTVAVTPAPSPAPVAPEAPTLTSDTDWPTFAHDLSRTSTQPGSSAISASSIGQMQLLWHYKSASPFDLSSPVESAGIVYASDDAGNMIAANEATGVILWQRSFGQAVKVTPAVYDGHLFIGTFDNAAGARSILYSLDPVSGSVNWQTSVPGALHGSPVAMNGELYVPVSLGDPGFCNPGGVYQFDETTGTSGVHWLTGGTTANNGGAIWSPLTYDGTRILYGTGNTCLTSPQTSNAVVALTPYLQQLWSDQTANPATDDDVGGGVIESNGYAYVTGKNGNLYALNASTGAVRWQKGLGVPDLLGSYATPSIAANTLITSIGYRFNPYATEPVGTQYGGLVGLDPTTGATVWSTPIEAESRSAIAVANNEIIVSDTDGYLYAFGLPSPDNAAARAREASFHVTPGVPRFVNRIPVFCSIRK